MVEPEKVVQVVSAKVGRRGEEKEVGEVICRGGPLGHGQVEEGGGDGARRRLLPEEHVVEVGVSVAEHPVPPGLDRRRQRRLVHLGLVAELFLGVPDQQGSRKLKMGIWFASDRVK